MSEIPHYTDYRCTECGLTTERELLTVKKATFSPLGAGAKVTRSRTIAWLCNGCLPKDEDYKREAFKGAPGLISPALERVRLAEQSQRRQI